MSMNGHLLEVSPDLVRKLREDPTEAARVTLRFSVMGGARMTADDVPGMVDAALLSASGVGCLWGLLPRFARRALLVRVLPRAGDPDPERVEQARAALREGLEEEDLDEEDLDEEDLDEEDLDEEAQTDEEREQVRQVRASFAALKDATGAPPPAGAGEHLDLHKDWHLLHVCLTGSADDTRPPAGDAILGGDELGDDLGYGPARLLDPPRVAAVAAFLRELGPGGVVARFRPRSIGEEVYGSDFATERGYPEELRVRAEQLCRFYGGAAARGSGVLLWIS